MQLAVGASGVWVLEAREWAGSAVAVRDVGTWRQRDQRLFVGDTDRTDGLDAIHATIGEVTAYLGQEVFWAKVRGLLCISGASWPLWAGGLSIGAVGICRSRAAAGIVSGKGTLEPDDVERLAGRLGALACAFAAPAA